MTVLLTDLAKQVDARSSRSVQRKLGPSSLGTCRRRAGYEHHGVKPSNPENVSGIAAIVGTWIHKGALDVLRREAGALVETVVEDDRLRGHVDVLWLDEPGGPVVEDLKTRRDERLVDYVRNRGPKRSELYQVMKYADLLRRGKVKPLKRQKALAERGPIPVERVRLRYFARTGVDGAEYVHEEPFDPEIVAEADDWLAQVEQSESPDDLPRDEDGPGLSTVCDNCPFRTACWGEAGDVAPQAQLIVTDADLAQVLAEYADAQRAEAEARKAKDAARKKLDATDAAVYTADGATGYKLGWSGGNAGDPRPDVDAMIALFKEAGLEVPYLPPRPSPRTIRVTRWENPEKRCGKPVLSEEDLDRRPYVEDAKTVAEAVARSAEIDRNEADTLDPGEDRDCVLMSAMRWEALLAGAPSCALKRSHSGACSPAATLDVA